MVSLSGTFTDPSSNPVALGTLVLVLSKRALVNGTCWVSTAPVRIGLDNTGSIPNGTEVFGVDAMTPSGLIYLYSVYSASGQEVVRPTPCSPTGSSFSFDS